MKELEIASHWIFLSDKISIEYFSENAMLEQFHLKSLHLESTKQERLFLSLMAVMGIVMEHEQKNLSNWATEYTNSTNTKNT